MRAGILISPPATPRTPLTAAIRNPAKPAMTHRASPLGSASTCTAWVTASTTIHTPTANR